MKIHSDVLRFQDIQDAVPSGCYLASFHHPGFGRTLCGFEGSRSRERGFVVYLSGSSRYAMQSNRLTHREKAATYDEWGDFIARLFSIDPAAKIGCYKNAEDFEAKTKYKFLVRPKQRIEAIRKGLHPSSVPVA